MTLNTCSSARLLAAALLITLGVSGCDNQSRSTPPLPEPEPLVLEDPELDRATIGIWLRGVGILDAGIGEARELVTAVEALLETPGEESLQKARSAWHRAHNAYLQYELFTALGGSNPGLFGPMGEYDFAVEAWPIQPGYLDAYDVYTHSGIVNDAAMPLTAEALRQQHGFTDASDVSLGFHALEYLLWGEDSERPAEDFAQAQPDTAQENAGVRPVDLPGNRRRTLTALLANLLVDDLSAFKEAVENPNGLLRRSYLALHSASRLELLQNAAYGLLNHHQNLLQAQLEGEGEAVGSDSLHHSPFAGGAARSFGHTLHGLEELLLKTGEDALGRWTLPEGEEQSQVQESLAQLRGELLAWEEQAWPPTGEQGAAMAARLSELADHFEPAEIPAPE
ncbi:imelysin family protein [Gilvimarinus sp. F26214L]|uniref:imelysin family protein n=1 Tax=Gilvimarinus sp. DZF01 TaxID=3461371 RepID=UPI0040452B2C